jgi:hypothetical protein
MGQRLFLLTQIFAEPLLAAARRIVKAFTGRIRDGEVRVTL